MLQQLDLRYNPLCNKNGALCGILRVLQGTGMEPDILLRSLQIIVPSVYRLTCVMDL